MEKQNRKRYTGWPWGTVVASLNGAEVRKWPIKEVSQRKGGSQPCRDLKGGLFGGRNRTGP